MGSRIGNRFFFIAIFSFNLSWVWSAPIDEEEKRNDSSSIKVEVHLVNIEVRVTDNGKPVRGLSREDFILKERGREQEIAFFHFVDAPVRAGEGAREEKSFPGQDLSRKLGAEQKDMDWLSVRQGQAVVPAGDPTWMHIVAETADPVEFRRSARAIRGFIESGMQPGLYISLGGMPFTDNKKILLSTLDRLEGKPFGPGSGIDPAMIHIQDLEQMREIALELPFAPDIEAIEESLQRTAMFDGPLEDAPVIGVETVNRQIRFFGEIALLRYMDLVERMALLPGRKAIVLFRNGLRLDHETGPILDRLLSLAARNRVSFYTVDSRGLDVVSPVKDLRYPLAWSRGRLESYLPDPIGEVNRRREAEEGLVVLARETGGWAVLDNNNLTSILDRVVQDSFFYYVVGYYPEHFTNSGKFRDIEISLRDDPGYNLAAVRGFMEPARLRLQSRAERLVSLRKSLQSSLERELQVEIEPEIFADSDGNPVLFVSVGAPATDFELKQGRDDSRISGEVLIQVVNRFSQNIPLYHDGRIDEKFDNSLLTAGKSPMVNYQTVLPLAPGIYDLKAVIRDRRSGRLGVDSVSFFVRNFRAESVPSTLLMTRHALPGNAGERNTSSEWHRNVLAAGNIDYFPQPVRDFIRGEVVHVLFHLYHPTPQDREWAKKGIQIGIFRQDVQVEGIKAHGQAFVNEKEEVIRYALVFDTENLAPGEYDFLALLPNYSVRKLPHLEESFKIIDP